MHKIVIDTNILVSAILSKSYPYSIVHDLIFQEKVISFTSDNVLSEFYSVIEYPKFKKYPGFILNAKNVVDGLFRFSILVQPTVFVDVLKDKSDNKFLDVALSCRADFLITGNSKDFTFKSFENTRIISPESYWNTHWK